VVFFLVGLGGWLRLLSGFFFGRGFVVFFFWGFVLGFLVVFFGR